MQCPNCQNELKEVVLDGIVVNHCGMCGGTFFDENEINRISPAQAHFLSRMKQTDSISGEEKFCPRDNQPLRSITDEAKPQYISLLRCVKCHGIFAYPDDLIHFKQAQNATISYYKAWHLPFPDLKKVMLYTLALFTAVSVLYSATTITSQKTIQASELIRNIQVLKQENNTIVCFTTKTPLTSSITLRRIAQGETITIPITQQPTTLHCRSFSQDEIPSEMIFYRVVLTTAEGELLHSEYKPLE